jgi:hypothetical protein
MLIGVIIRVIIIMRARGYVWWHSCRCLELQGREEACRLQRPLRNRWDVNMSRGATQLLVNDLEKHGGGYLGPANVAGFQEDGAADWLGIPGEENLMLLH